MLRVVAIHGEPTRFYVESQSLQCCVHPEDHLFSRHRKPHLAIGGACPKCGGQLDVRFHLVDIALFNANGQCACEWFAFKLGPAVSRVPLPEQGAGKWRCSHIEAARNFALDLSLKQHDRDRHERAGRQREGVGA